MINHKSSIINLPAGKAGRKSQSAFTLIELLIVIVIIGVLATILLANFIGVQQRARDSRRKSDLRQIQAALELIRSATGSYSTALYPAGGNCPTSGPLVVGTVTYMQKIPCDPSSIQFYIFPPGNYYYTSDGITYNLGACIENTNDKDPNASAFLGVFFRCSTRMAYIFKNP